MNIRPLEDRIVVRPNEPQRQTASGLYLPESSKERPIQGEVIAVGPGKPLDNGEVARPSVAVGDTVVYGRYAGTEVEIKGEKHLILRETELLGVMA